MAKKVYCLHHLTDCHYYGFDGSCDFVERRNNGRTIGYRKCRIVEMDDNKMDWLVTKDPMQAILIGIARMLKSPAVTTEYYCGCGDFTCPYYMNTKCKFIKSTKRNDKPSCEEPGLCATRNPHEAILKILARVTNELKKIKGER